MSNRDVGELGVAEKGKSKPNGLSADPAQQDRGAERPLVHWAAALRGGAAGEASEASEPTTAGFESFDVLIVPVGECDPLLSLPVIARPEQAQLRLRSLVASLLTGYVRAMDGMPDGCAVGAGIDLQPLGAFGRP